MSPHTVIMPGVDFWSGDSVKLMQEQLRPEGCTAKLILTDPPYGVGWQAAGHDLIEGDEDAYRAALKFVPPMADRLADDGVMVLFNRADMRSIWERQMSLCGLTVQPWLTWDKMSNFHDAMNVQPEVVLIAFRGDPRIVDDGASVLSYKRLQREEHMSKSPTPKPVDMMTYLIKKFTDPGDLVLDPFAGMAPIGVAAVGLGRNYLGVELEEERAANAIDRLRVEVNFQDARRRLRSALHRGQSVVDGSAGVPADLQD